jgi:hypothetical protein
VLPHPALIVQDPAGELRVFVLEPAKNGTDGLSRQHHLALPARELPQRRTESYDCHGCRV